jgi:hypothetical protein
MSEINITSDMTAEGTIATVDGKKPKGKIKNIDFSLYYMHPCCCCHCSPCSCEMEPFPVVRLSYNVEEELEDGTVKTTNFCIEKRGEDEVVEDSKDLTMAPEQIMDFLKKKFQGKI